MVLQDGTEASDVSSLTGILGRSQLSMAGASPIGEFENTVRFGSVTGKKGCTTSDTAQEAWCVDGGVARCHGRRPQPADSLGVSPLLHLTKWC